MNVCTQISDHCYPARFPPLTNLMTSASRTARSLPRQIGRFLTPTRPYPNRFFSITSQKMAQEYKLKGVSSIALQPGEKQEVEVEGLDAKVLLLNAGGTVQAVGPRCTHYGAPLVKGVLGTNGKLTCPWHGGKTRGRSFLPRCKFPSALPLTVPPISLL